MTSKKVAVVMKCGPVHHNHLIRENIVHMNLNAIIPSVYISSISYCMKITKASLLLNVTETCSCKRPCPDHQID